MLRKSISGLTGFAFCTILCSTVLAGNHKPADFPLRIHVFAFQGTSHSYGGRVTFDEGDGRANLYENGEPKALEFKFTCPDHLRASFGYETYMARWKKSSANTLEMLLPEVGKPTSTDVCELKVDVRDSMAYVSASKVVPAADFKRWMDRTQYDPEHDKNVPIAPAAASKAPAQTLPGSAGPH
jgi:hypothetical protein